SPGSDAPAGGTAGRSPAPPLDRHVMRAGDRAERVRVPTYPDAMDRMELLAGVMAKTTGVIAGVSADTQERPTPCPGYDVAAMVRHLVGWVRSFEASADGRTFEGDPSAVELGVDPAAQCRASADRLGASWPG